MLHPLYTILKYHASRLKTYTAKCCGVIKEPGRMGADPGRKTGLLRTYVCAPAHLKRALLISYRPEGLGNVE